MPAMKTRDVVHIDEEKCDGCGACVPNCAEGAIQVIDGKARLLAENLCDGLGACLGICPQDAITVEKRSAEDFDEEAVKRQLAKMKAAAVKEPKPEMPCGCPGSRQRSLRPTAAKASSGAKSGSELPSRLTHWPVQLTLLPEIGGLWDGADMLLSADCVPYAMAGFHDKLLAGKSVAIACPKLDDAEAYVEKLARIFKGNAVKSITVARMEVPCCGLDQIARMALERAGVSIPMETVVVSLQGR